MPPILATAMRGHHDLGDHRQEDADHVAVAQAVALEQRGEPVDLRRAAAA